MLPGNTIQQIRGAAVGTDFGIMVPPGGEVYFVGSSRPGERLGDGRQVLGTTAAAMASCRAGYGDTICFLPGHTESISSTFCSAWKAGVRLIGLGDPRQSDAPTFTCNAVASTLAIAAANVKLRNLRLILGGADEVTKAINVTAAGVAIENCWINVGTTSALNAAIALEVGTGANSFRLASNYIVGEVAGAVTDGVLIAAAVLDLVIENNEMFFATGAVSTGNIRGAAVAALRVQITGNRITNSLASSETAIGWGDAAATGRISGNFVASLTGTPVSDLIELAGAASVFHLFDNKGTDTRSTSGLLTPAVVT